MRLNSLHLFNFRQHIDTRIEFDTGITGIIGPNGSGKSTILEAIAWALYGMPAARGTRESICSSRAAPRAAVRVELDFELGGHRYRIARGLTSAELFLDGAAAPIATSITAVTELLRRRLGMSHDEFFNTYFTGQKELSVMAAMGAAERAQFLSRVLGYERLRTAQGLVRDRRKEIAGETAGLKAGMPDAENVARVVADAEARLAEAQTRARASADQRAIAKRALDDATPRWEAAQRERDLSQTIVAELRVAESERAALERESARLDRELSETGSAGEELARLAMDLAPLSPLQAELQELDRALGEEGRRRTLVESERALAEELPRLRDRCARLESAPGLEAEAAADVARVRAELEAAQLQLEGARTEWVRDRQEAETKRQALLEQLRDAERQREHIVELGEDGICPTCSRPLGTHFRTVLELLDSQIETITVDGKYYRARMEQLEAMPPEVAALDERRRQGVESVAKLERRLTKVQLAIQELSALAPDLAAKEQRYATIARDLAAIDVVYDAVRHGDVRAAIERLGPVAARSARVSAQLEREPQLKQDRERVGAQVVQAQGRMAELAERRDTLAFSAQSFETIRALVDAAATSLRVAELAAASADSDAASGRTALETANRARAELARIEATLARYGRDRLLHEELDRTFSDLRTDLNQDVRPEISERASRHLRELTDGRYSDLEVDEQYNIKVLEDAIPKPVISGGEEDLANLVLRLAISEMIAERAGQSFSLLILDEVFGSLDETRRHNVVELLRRLHDRFEQVVLITHIESVREGVDRAVTVRYDEESGISRVDAESAVAGFEFGVQAGAAD
jgi:DNA repair protein SbcC/Rad50